MKRKTLLSVGKQQALDQYRQVLQQLEDLSPITARNYVSGLRHRFGYHVAEVVPLHQLAQIIGQDSLDTAIFYVQGATQDLQRDVKRSE